MTDHATFWFRTTVMWGIAALLTDAHPVVVFALLANYVVWGFAQMIAYFRTLETNNAVEQESEMEGP